MVYIDYMLRPITLIGAVAVVIGMEARAATPILFDFDDCPVNTGLPYVTLPRYGVQATLTPVPNAPTDNGYAFWPIGTAGASPVGMGGTCIYPSGVFLTDLQIEFNQPISDFSILYSPHELSTDSSATLQIKAYNGGTLLGSNTDQITGLDVYTWPTGTLHYAATAFDKVVLHYYSGPPIGGDYGVIFIVDNMQVVPVPEPASALLLLIGGAAMGLRRRRYEGE